MLETDPVRPAARVRVPDPYLASLVLYLDPTLQGCYQVLKSCDLGYILLCYQLLNPR